MSTRFKGSAMTLSAYAKHRGVTPKAVSKAVAEGRLLASVVRVDGAPRILDAALADREWEQNSRERRDRWRLDGGKQSAEQAKTRAVNRARIEWAKARREAAEADIAEMKLEELRRQYLPRDIVIPDVRKMFALVRDRVLSVVPRTGKRCPQLTPAQLALLEELIRECIEEISDESITRFFGGDEDPNDTEFVQ